MSLQRLTLAVALTTGVLAMPPAIAEELPDAVKALVPTFQQWGTNPVLIQAVREQNALGRSLDEIKRLDADWMAASGITPLMAAMQDNPPARELRRLEQTQPYFIELFLMDGQGANVAMTNKTSDYWQGDEDKFTRSFNAGQGGVDMGEIKFDSSAQAYLVQISVPVMDEGQAIGALTIGIDLDRLGQAQP
ncbi:cache domain-containing protein [Thiocystis violacea]|uniref:cache domain-containing protein n=1 Tax=Thiocystis violacea TaxID=13725 RepID=UPI0019069129|nr:cache domain-containing protein [Thiocystis violacea]MBK1717555.1 hypothetical protein [Thiocystis violacea]